MARIHEISGIPTKEKAKEIALQIRLLKTKWTVEVIGNNSPYTVRSTPPETNSTSAIAEEGSIEESTDNIFSLRSGILGFLDFIAQYESRGNYNARYGAVANINKPAFTSISINEVLEWQKGRKFSACGKYQIIRQTLLELVEILELNGRELFDATMQDKMGNELLKGRKLKKYLTDKISRDQFAFNVAQEWAALPGVIEPYGEKSVYAGDGINHALVSVSSYLAAVDQLKSSV